MSKIFICICENTRAVHSKYFSGQKLCLEASEPLQSQEQQLESAIVVVSKKVEAYTDVQSNVMTSTARRFGCTTDFSAMPSCHFTSSTVKLTVGNIGGRGPVPDLFASVCIFTNPEFPIEGGRLDTNQVSFEGRFLDFMRGKTF